MEPTNIYTIAVEPTRHAKQMLMQVLRHCRRRASAEAEEEEEGTPSCTPSRGQLGHLKRIQN
jgi:hypothetical protein